MKGLAGFSTYRKEKSAKGQQLHGRNQRQYPEYPALFVLPT
jgi:hypothetical protein